MCRLSSWEARPLFSASEFRYGPDIRVDDIFDLTKSHPSVARNSLSEDETLQVAFGCRYLFLI
jgi:hypothetical protein